MKYRDAVTLLDRLVNYEKRAAARNEFKLDSIRRLLRLAGNPERQLKKVVLIAGTKGKGSVCHMLDAALRGCGIGTGMFVSPHVCSVRERIQSCGVPIARREFARVVEGLVPSLRRQKVSYFEMTTAMAFEAFRRARPDCCIVEVGLGGRLDATNLSDPAVSVITRIGLDHISVLGGTVRKIAREKAGIMRAGRPVVIGEQGAEAGDELRRAAAKAGAIPVPVERQVRVWDAAFEPGRSSFSVLSGLGAGRFALPLLGRHQVENCATVLAVLGVLAREDGRIRLAGVAEGLAGVRIPARCEVVSTEPLVIVDSCHNPDSGRALAEALKLHVGQRVTLVYGSLQGKLVRQTVRPLVPWIEQAVLVRPDSPRGEDTARLKRVFRALGVRAIDGGSVRDGIDLARERARGGPLVVAGSFYVAGEALACLGSNVGLS